MTTEDDPLVEISVEKLRGLVAKTPFSMREFEQLIGWSFDFGDAPASKRKLAWDVLNLSKENLGLLHRMQKHLPRIWVMEVLPWGGSSGVEQ